MYILNDNGNYVCRGSDNRFYLSKDINKAAMFKTENRASNACLNLPKTMKNRNFKLQLIDSSVSSLNIENFQTLKENINLLAMYDNDIGKYQNQMREQLSIIDLELTDIDHYIEFNKLSASEGYKISKLRQDKLKKRREIKDSLYTCSLLKKHSSDSKKIMTEIKNRECREYHPRVMKELFI